MNRRRTVSPLRHPLAVLLLALLAALPLAPPARAENCTLKLIASLPMLPNKEDVPIVPVTVNGQQARLGVGTAMDWSAIKQPFETGSWTQHANIGVAVGDGSTDLYFEARQAKLGDFVIPHAQFFIIPDDSFLPDVDGVIGSNIVDAMDVEFDFAAHRVDFISPRHCPGQVVHWPHSDLAILPLTIGPYGSLVVPARLDGKPIEVRISTLSRLSAMSMDRAGKLFGLSPLHAGVTRAPSTGKPASGETGKATFYRYRFESLVLDGITFRHPLVELVDGGRHMSPDARLWRLREGFVDTALGLGLRELRQLHLYFAFGERKLYVTTVAGDAAARAALARTGRPAAPP